jgi:GT2 family glycosyltransferase
LHLKIGVVIPTRNRAPLLARCLSSITDQIYPISVVIVVDNGSTDETSELIKQYPKVVSIRHEENQGIDAALACGIEHVIRLGMDAVFITDDDSFLLPTTLSTLVETMIKFDFHAVVNALPLVNEKGALISPKVFHGIPITTKNEFQQYLGRIVHTNKVHFNGSLLSRQILESVGLPDKRFFSGEETAYGDRVLEKGFDIVIDAQANILHPLLPIRLIKLPLIGYISTWDLPEWKARHYPSNALIRRRIKHSLVRFLIIDIPLVFLVYIVRLIFERNRRKKAKWYFCGLLNGIIQGLSFCPRGAKNSSSHKLINQ